MADQPFMNVKNNIFNRHFGGQWEKATWSTDPYVTGYHFIRFDKMPKNIYTTDKSLEVADMITILSACCTGVTPPGGTLTNIEYTGLGGIKWGVPGGVDYGNSITIKYIEMDGTPIYKINHAWFKMIRDYRLGISVGKKEGNYADLSGSHSKANYAAVLYYWTTAPDGITPEYYACYDGVYPTKDPQDSFSSDVETIGRLDIDIEYHLDFIWTEPWVQTKVQGFYSAGGDNTLRSSTDNFLKFSL